MYGDIELKDLNFFFSRQFQLFGVKDGNISLRFKNHGEVVVLLYTHTQVQQQVANFSGFSHGADEFYKVYSLVEFDYMINNSFIFQMKEIMKEIYNYLYFSEDNGRTYKQQYEIIMRVHSDDTFKDAAFKDDFFADITETRKNGVTTKYKKFLITNNYKITHDNHIFYTNGLTNFRSFLKELNDGFFIQEQE